MVNTDLMGEYVIIPEHGDAGWIRAVFVSGESLRVLVQRDNVSHDFKTYRASQMTMPTEKK